MYIWYSADRGMAYIYSASGLVGLADDVQGMFASVNECVCVCVC